MRPVGAEGAAAGTTYGGEGTTYGGEGATYGGEGSYGGEGAVAYEAGGYGGGAGADYYGTSIPATQQGGGPSPWSWMSESGGSLYSSGITSDMVGGTTAATDMTGGRYFGGTDVPPEEAFSAEGRATGSGTSQGLLSSRGFDWGKFWKQFGEQMLKGGGGKKRGGHGTAMVGSPPSAAVGTIPATDFPARGGGGQGQRPASPATMQAPSGFVTPRSRQGFAQAVQAAFGGR